MIKTIIPAHQVPIALANHQAWVDAHPEMVPDVDAPIARLRETVAAAYIADHRQTRAADITRLQREQAQLHRRLRMAKASLRP